MAPKDKADAIIETYIELTMNLDNEINQVLGKELQHLQTNKQENEQLEMEIKMNIDNVDNVVQQLNKTIAGRMQNLFVNYKGQTVFNDMFQAKK